MDRDGRGSSSDFDPMARRPQRPDQERLPSLSEVLPEIHKSGNSKPPPQPQYPRHQLSQYPIGPPPFPDSRSLAPAPVSQPPSFGSNHSPSASRGSPALPSVHALQNGNPPMRDARNLPPIYTNGGVADDPQRRPSAYESMSPVASGPPGGHPGYVANGVRPPDYGPYASRPGYPNGPLNFEPGDYVDGKQKKRRGNLPKPVTDILRKWFQDHIAHPYPTEDEKQMLMNHTGLTISQISNWFINARRRNLPQMAKQGQVESELRDGPR